MTGSSRAGAFVRVLCLSLLLGACGAMSTGDPTSAEDPAAPDAAAASEGGGGLADDTREWITLDEDSERIAVAFATEAGGMPRNESFALDVVVLRDGIAATGCRLVVRADMPAHGHGLVRGPRVIDQGDGRFRVESLLLHMRGHWVIFFDVTDSEGVETLRYELDL